MSEASCTVVVIGYDGESWLERCLTSLRASTSRALRLVLVDNGGNGSFERLPLAEFETVVLPAPRRMGFAEANNFALVAGGFPTDAVCFLNQDTLSEPGWLDECLDVLFETPGLGGVSPLLRTFDDEHWDEGFISCARQASGFQEQAGRSQPVRFVVGPEVTAAAMVVRSDVLRETGPFDPVYGSYYEDYDLCWRIQQAGFRVAIANQSVVRHFGGSSSTTPERKRLRMRQVIRNRAIYRIRRAGPRRVQALFRMIALDFPRNIARGLLKTASSQPVGVQIQALRDLASIGPRLFSSRRDQAEWRRYLERLGWESAAGPLPAPAEPRNTLSLAAGVR